MSTEMQVPPEPGDEGRSTPFALTDHQLEQLRRKDRETWEQVISHNWTAMHEMVSRTLVRFRLSTDIADDVTQRTWMKAIEIINSFTMTRHDSFGRWLWKIQYNYVRNLSREPEPHSVEEEGFDLETYLHQEPGKTDEMRRVENEIIYRETRREILAAIDLVVEDLPPHHREIVLARLVRREQPSKLAEMYNLKPSTVYQVVSDAKRKLSSYLQTPALFLPVYNSKLGRGYHKD